MLYQFLCGKTSMKFYSNPYDKEFVLDLSCELFDVDDRVGIHFFIGDEIEIEEDAELVINRTDLSYQTFKIDYDKDLEFLEISKS